MPSINDSLAFIGIVATLLVSAYATSWAFRISRALAVRTYRNQAVGIGLVAISAPLGFFAGTELDFGAYWIVAIYIALVVLLFWADASAKAARRSDPLLRDTLHWRQLRRWLWSSNIALMVSYLSLAFYIQATGFCTYCSGPPPDITSSPIFIALLIIQAIMTVNIPLQIALVAVLLLLSVRRSADETLRNHLRWFGLFVVSFLAGTLASIVSYPEHHAGIGFLTYAGYFVGGYFLYRSARSLVPLNKLSLSASDK